MGKEHLQIKHTLISNSTRPPTGYVTQTALPQHSLNLNVPTCKWGNALHFTKPLSGETELAYVKRFSASQIFDTSLNKLYSKYPKISYFLASLVSLMFKFLYCLINRNISWTTNHILLLQNVWGTALPRRSWHNTQHLEKGCLVANRHAWLGGTTTEGYPHLANVKEPCVGDELVLRAGKAPAKHNSIYDWQWALALLLPVWSSTDGNW